MGHDHPDPSTDDWANPDFCPFCGTRLTDPGAGFIDHLDESESCRERFADWREHIADDIGSEWSG
ncbi:DUF7501 family protein [Salinibaculum salinum]|uniref:DUF7501 family protein n=1 Tax=Salinibaculum salinum TaxID=3131996 RepID=UPI0030EE993E